MYEQGIMKPVKNLKMGGKYGKVCGNTTVKHLCTIKIHNKRSYLQVQSHSEVHSIRVYKYEYFRCIQLSP
jgi:hypothetical protein